MSAQPRGWVLLNYPVVTSRSRDNAGGYDHLIGNLQAYRHLGFQVVCICRWSPRLIDRVEGALVLNIVPGAAQPAQQAQVTTDDTAAPVLPVARSRRWAQTARTVVLALLGACLQRLLRPQLLHQRANLRLMLTPRNGVAMHLVELNDEYVPPTPCDAYLTVTRRQTLASPQYVWRWPVPEVAHFNLQLFQRRLARLANPDRPLKVLLFGIGGTTEPQAIRHFIGQHPWFVHSRFELHIYGGETRSAATDGVEQHGWCDPGQLDTQGFDAAVLYYDLNVYDDARLNLGSPTKLWKYIDWSLPVFCNRPQVSALFLGDFDTARDVLVHAEQGDRYADHLQALRKQTLPTAYADGLSNFLAGLRRGATTPAASGVHPSHSTSKNRS